MSLNANIYIIVTTFILCLTLILIKDNSRDEFEEILLNKYKGIPFYTEEELANIPKPDQPHLGAYQNNFMIFDPELGYVPSERLIDAFGIKERLPQNRSTQWNSIDSNMGGRTRTFMFDPNDQDGLKVWAAGVSGGLWYNNNLSDINETWNAVDDFWDNLSVSKITHDPNNTNIYYVGTGEANTATITYRESSSRGVGIWKSINSGETWELLESTFPFEYITDIELKDNNGTTEIYTSVASGTYQGSDHQSLPSDGLYKSIDGGINWIQVLPNIPGTSVPFTPSDIEITSEGRIFVGTMKNLSGEGGSVILYSDSGELDTWISYNDYQSIIQNSNTNDIPGRVILTSSKNNPNYVYAVYGAGFLNNMNFNLSHGSYILKSSNSGNSWIEVNLPTNDPSEWASLAWHALALSVHPDNPNIIFAGGLELYRSEDGGINWDNLSDWSLMYYGGGDRYIHADIHQIIFNPNNSNMVVIPTDGGIFYTTEILSNEPQFIERNHGYNTLQFYTCDISSEMYGNYYIGGLQDNGTLGIGFGNDTDGIFDINDMVSGGDGAYCFFDENESILLTSTYYNVWYIINLENNEYEYVNGNSGVFINPADYDSQNNILYANKVKFNGNQSNRIIKVESDGNISTINLNTNTSVYFSSLKVSPFSTSQHTDLFLGTQSGRLYKVSNVGNTNTVVEIGSNDFPTANISSIDFGNNDNEIMITISNYGVSSIWYTSNGGNTWAEKEGNLPDIPVRWGILHPENNNFAMIATEIGVWESNNFLSNDVVWLPSSNGLGNVRVDMLSIRPSDNTVIAGTHGRGLYYGEFTTNESISGDINSDNNINVLDVVLLVNLVLDNSNYNQLADINSDMIINILDIVELINLILGE